MLKRDKNKNKKKYKNTGYSGEYFWANIKVDSLDKITEYDDTKVKTTFYAHSQKLAQKILCVIWKRVHLNIGDELKVLGRFKNEKTVFAISKIIITKRNRNEVNNG